MEVFTDTMREVTIAFLLLELRWIKSCYGKSWSKGVNVIINYWLETGPFQFKCVISGWSYHYSSKNFQRKPKNLFVFQSNLYPHIASTPIVDDSIPIIFLPPYPPSYDKPYILPYPPPCPRSYPTSLTSSHLSFNFIPIPRTTIIMLINLTLPPIITIRLPPFPRLHFPHKLQRLLSI